MTCASLAPLDFTCLQMLVDRNRRYQEHDQHYGDSRRNGPVLVGKKFRPQGLADHGGIGTAQQIRNDELTDDGHEAQKSPAPRPRTPRGSVMTKKVFQRGQPRSAAASSRLSSNFSKVA